MFFSQRELFDMNKDISKILLNRHTTVLDAIRAMEERPKENRPAGIVIVVDPERRVEGVVTDGDIRRAMLSGLDLHQPLERIMTKNPIIVREDQVEVGSYSEVLRYIRRTRRMLDPAHGKVVVVDEHKRVVDVISLFELLKLQSARAQTICIVGMGYVGLTLAVALAEVGLTVSGIEQNSRVRELLEAGDVHFYEAGLDRIYRSHLGRRLFLGADLRDAQADVYLICVGTPVDERGEPMLRDLEVASESVGVVLKRGDLVGVRSTVPIGTSRGVVLPILERVSGLTGGRHFDFVFAPERTAAGSALTELFKLPQVLGSLTRSGLERASSLFRELTSSVITVESLEEAEAVKLLNNTFRDHVFSFANDVALLCDRLKLDTDRVIRAANEGYPRNPIPQASPGVGGVCLRKDPYLLLASARSVGYEPFVIGHSRRVNERMPHHVFEKTMHLLETMGKDPLTSRIFIVGFAFKGEPETSDMRDSSTLTLVDLLRPKVGVLLGYDPVVTKDDFDCVAGVTVCSVEEGFRGADCAVIMNNHRSYARWKIDDLLNSMRRPALLVDGWRMFEASDVCKTPGVTYWGLGGGYVSSDQIRAAAVTDVKV